MTASKFMLVSVLSLCCSIAFAQDGADMLQKRQEAFALERQQAREKLASSQEKARKDQAAASTSNQNASAQQVEVKPAS